MPEVQKFENEDQKKETLIQNLRDLQNHVGWKIIVKQLDIDIDSAGKKLFREEEMKEGETDDHVRIARHITKKLLNLPQQLIQDNIELEAFDPKLDPYN